MPSAFTFPPCSTFHLYLSPLFSPRSGVAVAAAYGNPAVGAALYCANDGSVPSAICNYYVAPYFAGASAPSPLCAGLGTAAVKPISALISSTYCGLTTQQTAGILSLISGTGTTAAAFSTAALGSLVSAFGSSALSICTNASLAAPASSAATVYVVTVSRRSVPDPRGLFLPSRFLLLFLKMLASLSPPSPLQSSFTTPATGWTTNLTSLTNTAVQTYLNTNAGISTITCSSSSSSSRRRRLLVGQTAVATSATIPAGTSAAALAKAQNALKSTSSISSAIAAATGITPTVSVAAASTPSPTSSSATSLSAVGGIAALVACAVTAVLA